VQTPNTCIIIVGPTAVGKTALAIDLASHVNTEIISADSRQCFRELGVGVAKPSAEQLLSIPHHFINSHSIHEEVNAAIFEKYALQAAEKIFSSRNRLVMVGGTGLYIKAFTEGMDLIPPIAAAIRNDLVHSYEKNGLHWLQEQVRTIDPAFYETGEIKNPQRLLRALEVKIATGNSIRSFQRKERVARNFRVIKIGLELPRELLNDRIHARVDQMMKDGLEDEVKALKPYQHINALQTVGYREMFDHFRGLYNLQEAVNQIKTNTRQYAKRQMTWFKKDPEINWFAPTETQAIIHFLDSSS